MEEPLLTSAQVVPHAGAASIIGHRRLDAARLVHRKYDVSGRCRDAHAVDLDHRGPWINPHALLDNELAVDLDTAFLDHLLAGASATDSGSREHLLKTDKCGVVIPGHNVSIST